MMMSMMRVTPARHAITMPTIAPVLRPASSATQTQSASLSQIGITFGMVIERLFVGGHWDELTQWNGTRPLHPLKPAPLVLDW